MSVMHGQCDVRPMLTFPAARHHRPLAGTNLRLLQFINNLLTYFFLLSEHCTGKPSRFVFGRPWRTRPNLE